MSSTAPRVAPGVQPISFEAAPHTYPQVATPPPSGASADFRESVNSPSSGIPGRGVVLISALTTAGCAALNLALTGRLTLFFDLCFVVVALNAAMSVLRRNLFTAGVLPPLLFAAVVGAIALAAPEVFIQTGDVSRAFLTGLAEHAGGLVTAYAVALAVVVSRVVFHPS